MKHLKEREVNQEFFEQSEMLRVSYENALDGLISFNNKGAVTSINRKMLTLLDLPREDTIGLHFIQVFEMLGIELLEVNEDYNDIIKDSNFMSTDEWKISNLKCNGYVLEVSSILLLKEKDVIGFTLSAHDITKKKREEEKLKVSNKRLKDTIELGKIVGWEYDTLQEEMTLSDEIYTLGNWDPDLRPPSKEEVSNYKQQLKKKLRELGERYILGDIEDEYYYQYPHNTTKWYKATMKRETDRYGKMVKLKGIIQDAKEHNKNEALTRIMRTISRAADILGDFKELMKLINQELKAVLDIKDLYIVTYDQGKKNIQKPFCADEDSIIDLMKTESTLIDRVMRKGRTLLAREGERNIWIGIPLKDKNEIIGVIIVQDRYDTDTYSKEKIELLEYVSSEVSKAVRLQQYRLQLEKVFKDKIVMHEEIHHRVNNNLQIIIALLNLQGNSIKTKNEAIKGFKESQDRIVALARVYEKFYESENISDINIAEYITSISNNLKRNYDKTNKVRIEYNIETIHLNLNQLVKLGLILNELITNSIKYAFKGKQRGIICIKIKKYSECCTIIVEDDGIGIPEMININNPKTLGLSIVNMLTEEMGCRKSVLREGGTKFVIEMSHGEGD